MFESLETRRMLSAVSTKFEPALSTYMVFGSPGKDHIQVNVEAILPAYPRGSDATAAAASAGTGFDGSAELGFEASRTASYERVDVYDAGTLVSRAIMPLGSMKELHVLGDGGDDVILVSNHGAPARVMISGDGGNDHVESVSYAGAPGSVVYGGEGDDFVSLVTARGSTDGHVAWGNEGNDSIFGSDGDDQIFGDTPGSRDVITKDGDDVLFGGFGNDTLLGGGGADQLYGWAGDDFLDGGLGTDRLDGGEGFDTAVWERRGEVMISIERLVGRRGADDTADDEAERIARSDDTTIATSGGDTGRAGDGTDRIGGGTGRTGDITGRLGGKA